MKTCGSKSAAPRMPRWSNVIWARGRVWSRLFLSTLPRYFADTNKVQDLESRLVTCMETLQGFNAADIAKTPFGKGEQNNVTALATWIAAESRDMKFNLPQAHVKETSGV